MSARDVPRPILMSHAGWSQVAGVINEDSSLAWTKSALRATFKESPPEGGSVGCCFGGGQVPDLLRRAGI